MQITRTYLEMRRPGQLVAAGEATPDARIDRVIDCPPSFYRYLYAEVGREWHWVDRLGWDDEAIRAHLAHDSIALWVLWVGGGSNVTRTAPWRSRTSGFCRGSAGAASARNCSRPPSPRRGTRGRAGSGCTPARSTTLRRFPTTWPADSLFIKKRPIRLICNRLPRRGRQGMGGHDDSTPISCVFSLTRPIRPSQNRHRTSALRSWLR